MTPPDKLKEYDPMRRIAVMMGTAAVLLWAAGVANAQDRPDLSGTWTLDAEKTAADGSIGGGGGGRGGGRGGRGGGGGAMTLKQDASTLTIERQGGRGGATSTAYKLDGSETTITTGRGEQTATAKWDGAKLVVSVTGAGRGGGMQTTTTAYSMEGAWLVVEATRPGRGGGEPTTTKVYYSKG